MNGEIHMHDVVALIEDTLAEQFEVEFAGRDSRAYALLPMLAHKLMVLRDVPELVIT
jgi:hypothetical protein